MEPSLVALGIKGGRKDKGGFDCVLTSLHCKSLGSPRQDAQGLFDVISGSCPQFSTPFHPHAFLCGTVLLLEMYYNDGSIYCFIRAHWISVNEIFLHNLSFLVFKIVY